MLKEAKDKSADVTPDIVQAKSDAVACHVLNRDLDI
jgi:hypothetical protein